VQRAFPFDDINHLVIHVAVSRRPAGIDHAEELRDVVRADLLVGEVAEAALASCGEGRAVGVADGALLPRGTRPILLREADGDDEELIGPRVVNLVRLPRSHVGAGVRLEVV
jgi:hypothetical protein